MNNNLEKVTIASIEEGKFLQDINEALAAIQAQTIEFSDRHKARAKNAKTKLVIEIQIGCISPDDGAFAFATQIKKVLPSEPANVTLAMAGATEGGKMALFARPSGTGRDTPNQKILTTEDGRIVDPLTGAVEEESAAAE